MATQQIQITLVKSTIGRLARHRATVRCLGLRKLHQTTTVDDTPTVRGMINSVNYLLKIDEPMSEFVSE